MSNGKPGQAGGGAAADGEISRQLAHYEVHARLIDQVTAFIGQLGTLANLFMIATGAAWAVLAPNSFNLPSSSLRMALVLHIVLCVAVLIVMLGLAKAITHRLDFAQAFGDALYPDIEALGRETAKRIWWGQSKLIRLGGPALSWAAIPIIAIVGSALILRDDILQATPQRAACEARWTLLMQATDRMQLDRARYLLDKGGCDLKTDVVKKSEKPQT